MISELNDNEILDFLMTSDFEGDYKPDEFKYLLVKWRYFYRVLHSRQKNNFDNYEFTIEQLNGQIESLKQQNVICQQQLALKQDELSQLVNKKLTLKERISGKITTTYEN